MVVVVTSDCVAQRCDKIILKASNQEMQPVEDSAAKSYKSKEESYEDSWDCKEEFSENAKEPALVGHSVILSLNCFFVHVHWVTLYYQQVDYLRSLKSTNNKVLNVVCVTLGVTKGVAWRVCVTLGVQ